MNPLRQLQFSSCTWEQYSDLGSLLVGCWDPDGRLFAWLAIAHAQMDLFLRNLLQAVYLAIFASRQEVFVLMRKVWDLQCSKKEHQSTNWWLQNLDPLQLKSCALVPKRCFYESLLKALSSIGPRVFVWEYTGVGAPLVDFRTKSSFNLNYYLLVE